MTHVFVVDGSDIERRGVRSMLAADPDITVLGDTGCAARAQARIPALRPDVVVLDVRLPDGDGIQLCHDLRAMLPDLKLLVLTLCVEDSVIIDAMLDGAGGYLVKDTDGATLVDAVHQVAAGQSPLDCRAAAALIDKVRRDHNGDHPLARLSDRECDILRLLTDGLTNRQIGRRVYLSEKTVRNYVSRLLAKLGLCRRAEAAIFAQKLREEHLL